MRSIASIALLMTWVSALTSPTPPPLHPALVTSCIAAQLGSGLDNVKLCLECFESIEDPISENGVNVMKVNSIFLQLTLVTALV